MLTPQMIEGMFAGIAEKTTEEKLKLDFHELNLSVRARKCLMRFGVSTIGDVVRLSPVEMLKCKNFGKVSLNDIKITLARIGLYLEGE